MFLNRVLQHIYIVLIISKMDYKDAFKKRANSPCLLVNKPRYIQQDSDHTPHCLNGKFTSHYPLFKWKTYLLYSSLHWLSNLLHFWGFLSLLCHLPFWLPTYYFLPENKPILSCVPGREGEWLDGGIVTGETPRNLVLLTNAIKSYRSESLLACK